MVVESMYRGRLIQIDGEGIVGIKLPCMSNEDMSEVAVDFCQSRRSLASAKVLRETLPRKPAG